MTNPDKTDLGMAYWLTRSVGRSIGLNFADAMTEGRLAPADYAALISICHACPREERCTAWLAHAGGPGGAERAPDFCPNARALQALKPH